MLHVFDFNLDQKKMHFSLNDILEMITTFLIFEFNVETIFNPDFHFDRLVDNGWTGFDVLIGDDGVLFVSTFTFTEDDFVCFSCCICFDWCFCAAALFRAALDRVSGGENNRVDEEEEDEDDDVFAFDFGGDAGGLIGG